jgi:hypothetical protein
VVEGINLLRTSMPKLRRLRSQVVQSLFRAPRDKVEDGPYARRVPGLWTHPIQSCFNKAKSHKLFLGLVYAKIHHDLRIIMTDRSVKVKDVWRRWASNRTNAETFAHPLLTPGPQAAGSETDE